MNFRASQTPRVIACPGSWKHEAQYPDERGEAAAEGTEAHDWAAKVLLNAKRLEDIPADEMRAACSLYVQTCGKYQGVWWAEKPLEMPLSGATVSGTPDFYCASPDGVLTIIDFKFGFGWVEVTNNWQLMTYALLVMNHLSGTWTPQSVRLVVVQPRANHPRGPVREWVIDMETLQDFQSRLGNVITNAMSDYPLTTPGDHCRYCRAVVDCHTNRRTVAELIDLSETAAPVDALDAPGLALELDALRKAADRIQHRLTAIESHAETRIRQGEHVPGWALKQKWTPLKWDVDAVQTGEYLGVDLRKPAEPVTPKQAIDRKLMDEQTVKSLASRRGGGFKLQRQNIEDARKIIAGANKQEVTQ